MFEHVDKEIKKFGVLHASITRSVAALNDIEQESIEILNGNRYYHGKNSNKQSLVPSSKSISLSSEKKNMKKNLIEGSDNLKP